MAMLFAFVIGTIIVLIPCAIIAIHGAISFNKQSNAALAIMNVSSYEELLRPIGSSSAK